MYYRKGGKLAKQCFHQMSQFHNSTQNENDLNHRFRMSSGWFIARMDLEYNEH